jgi:hypothetical protein
MEIFLGSSLLYPESEVDFTMYVTGLPADIEVSKLIISFT